MMGLTPCFSAFAIELHHREQIVLVGDRDRRHAERGGALHQLRDAHHAVLQRKFGVQAEVDESGRTAWRASLHTNARVNRVGKRIQRDGDGSRGCFRARTSPGFILANRPAKVGAASHSLRATRTVSQPVGDQP